jgi:hypothetical protein
MSLGKRLKKIRQDVIRQKVFRQDVIRQTIVRRTEALLLTLMLAPRQSKQSHHGKWSQFCMTIPWSHAVYSEFIKQNHSNDHYKSFYDNLFCHPAAKAMTVITSM